MESEMAQLANPQISASSRTVGRMDRRTAFWTEIKM